MRVNFLWNNFTFTDNVTQTYPSFYNNRGAVYLKVGNWHGALSDCSKALDLLTPPCKANECQRFKVYLRRGMALTNLGLADKALGEYRAAEAIFPENEYVLSEIEKLTDTDEEEKREESDQEDVDQEVGELVSQPREITVDEYDDHNGR